MFKVLLAKSGDVSGQKTRSQTIQQHTRAVIEAAERLVEMTGAAQLRALGLKADSWFDRLRHEIGVAALLHDLGKANDHFQGMIHRERTYPQAIRHEAVSYWIATRPPIREWIGHGLGDSSSVELVLWAIAGHHRKFPPPTPDDRAGAELLVFLSHHNFRETLAWGSGRLGLAAPPELQDSTLKFAPSRISVIREFENAQVEADESMARLSGESRRYLALLKACLIGADVAGSIGRKGSASMAEWIGEAFGNVPSPDQLDGIVKRKLKGKHLHPFQELASKSTNRVVFIRAGCGSGKTLAAYHWAARRWPGRRLFFCYPTMGTATEGYRDYLKDMDVDAALVHGRAEIDMEMLGAGDDEPDMTRRERPEDQPGRATSDSSGALDQWSTPLVSCTVDTVLGLVQNQRRGLYAWPSIAGAAIVFDEIHSYDEALFSALLRFLADVRGVPSLLMTASLPEARLDRIKATLGKLGETLDEVPGPAYLEKIKRYQRDRSHSRWDRVGQVLRDGGKVLWVVNTVDEAMALAATEEAKTAGAILYHSRYRYVDRVKRHQGVIDAFGEPRGTGALAITTQVAEMSLDLSADLLVTHLAPIAAMIQRLGRLNRRADKNDPWPFLVYRPEKPHPYEQEQLDEAETWLKELGDAPLSQSDLIGNWKSQPTDVSNRLDQFIWLDGGFVTEPRPLREATPGIEIILRCDFDDVKLKRRRPEEVRIPMPMPKDKNWRSWPDEVAFCKVPPDDRIEYDETWGGAMDELKIDLFEPGMSMLHRAGLGGLACTLNWIEKACDSNRHPPGVGMFDDRTVTLRWKGGPEGAGTFFKQLYDLAFDLKDGLIHLPGCYGMGDVRPEVKAELQQGMSLTILQFGPNRKATSKTPKVRTFDVDGQPMMIQHQDLTGYTHQSAWGDLVTSKGRLKPQVSISGTIAPGFVQRHVVHPTSTIQQPPGLAIALHFALVGTLSLAIDRKTGVMVVPDVQDLKAFVMRRHLLNPRNARGCQVNSPADAALQAAVRLRASETGLKLKLDRCQAVLFASQSWNEKQKTRATVLDVAADVRELDLFEEAMKIEELAPRLVLAKPEKKGEEPRPFWSKGVVRPLIAENLARQQPWYQDFRSLIVSADGRTDEERVRLLGFERKGIRAMIEKTPWQDRGEGLFVESIHRAIGRCFKEIREKAENEDARKNRIDRQKQRWRLGIAGAKTPNDLRKELGDLWSRWSPNSVLQAAWRDILPHYCNDDRWEMARDLALLALASYQPRGPEEAVGDESETKSYDG